MVRAYIIRLTGKDGTRASVTFDRHGMNASVFDGRTDQQAMNQAVSNALAGAIDKYGPGWLASYTVHTVN
jgi:hypothetical protein